MECPRVLAAECNGERLGGKEGPKLNTRNEERRREVAVDEVGTERLDVDTGRAMVMREVW